VPSGTGLCLGCAIAVQRFVLRLRHDLHARTLGVLQQHDVIAGATP